MRSVFFLVLCLIVLCNSIPCKWKLERMNWGTTRKDASVLWFGEDCYEKEAPSIKTSSISYSARDPGSECTLRSTSEGVKNVIGDWKEKTGSLVQATCDLPQAGRFPYYITQSSTNVTNAPPCTIEPVTFEAHEGENNEVDATALFKYSKECEIFNGGLTGDCNVESVFEDLAFLYGFEEPSDDEECWVCTGKLFKVSLCPE